MRDDSDGLDNSNSLAPAVLQNETTAGIRIEAEDGNFSYS
jgi:hypothetical protein